MFGVGDSGGVVKLPAGLCAEEGWKSKAGRTLVDIRLGLRAPNAAGLLDTGRVLWLAVREVAAAEALRRAGKTNGGFGSGPVGPIAYTVAPIALFKSVLIEAKCSTGNDTSAMMEPLETRSR